MSTSYSAIMAAHGASELIIDSLESITAQTLAPKEIILVLDGADENVEKMVSTYSDAVTIYTRPHQGQPAALNYGISVATGEYISFLDADDLWTPTKAEKQIAFLEEHKEYDAVCSGVRNFLDGTDVDSPTSKDFGASRLTSAATLRKSSLEKFGLLPDHVSHFEWQYKFWADGQAAGLRHGEISTVHLYRRIHGENSWVSQKEKGNATLLAFIREHKARKENPRG